MDEADLLNALKEKAQSISPLYVATWFSIIQERIEAAAAIGATDCPAKEFGVLGGRWDERQEKEMSILDFIRGANKTPNIFLSYKSRNDKTFCYMAYNIDGNSACLISNDDYYAMAYPVRQQLDEYLVEISVAIFHEVAQRLIQAGFALLCVKNPEADPRIGIAEENVDENSSDGEYEMYLTVSWEQLPPLAKQTPTSAPRNHRSFWHRIIRNIPTDLHSLPADRHVFPQDRSDRSSPFQHAIGYSYKWPLPAYLTR